MSIINELEQKIQEQEHLLKEYQEKIIYLTADFENFKRHADKERALWIFRAQQSVFSDLLNIVDDFDRAFETAQKQDDTKKELSVWLEGFSFIRQSLTKILQKYDVCQMEAHGAFDPEKHEAVQMVSVEGYASGDIVEVVRKGYLYKDQILRPAQVTVAQ